MSFALQKFWRCLRYFALKDIPGTAVRTHTDSEQRMNPGNENDWLGHAAGIASLLRLKAQVSAELFGIENIFSPIGPIVG